jgi:hypothetical protein
VGQPIDHQAAGAADPLTTVVVKGDLFFAAFDEFFVDDIEHLQKRHVLGDVAGPVFDELAGIGSILLPPYAQG